MGGSSTQTDTERHLGTAAAQSLTTARTTACCRERCTAAAAGGSPTHPEVCCTTRPQCLPTQQAAARLEGPAGLCCAVPDQAWRVQHTARPKTLLHPTASKLATHSSACRPSYTIHGCVHRGTQPCACGAFIKLISLTTCTQAPAFAYKAARAADLMDETRQPPPPLRQPGRRTPSHTLQAQAPPGRT